jgi:hypothetical protein
LKYEYGATLRTPLAEMVEIQPTGRGTTKAVNS